VAVRIVTDSTSDIPKPIIDELGITVVPLTIAFGAQSYRDGIDLGADEFYARLQQEKDLPTTSQPPPALFQHAYEHLITQGDVVSVHLSHKFSGTVESARRVAQELAPDRISVVDSGSASMGLGLCAIAAARAAQSGADRAACAATAEAVAARLQIAVAFETLEYLRRGGRIGRATAFVGGLLKLKPILTVKDGEAFPVTRVRSRTKAVEELFALIAKHQPVTDVVVLHTTTPDDAAALAARAREAAPQATIYEGRFGPVLGVHGGPGMLGVCVTAGSPQA
jgi:fatty acid kinase fatty acid binding subunit